MNNNNEKLERTWIVTILDESENYVTVTEEAVHAHFESNGGLRFQGQDSDGFTAMVAAYPNGTWFHCRLADDPGKTGEA